MYAVVSATKQDFRRGVEAILGDRLPGTLTSSSTSTPADTALPRYGEDLYAEQYLLIDDDTSSAAFQWRTIETYTPSTGSMSLRSVFSAAPGTKTYRIHKFRPDWYSQAYDEARRILFPRVHRPITYYFRGRNNVVEGFPPSAIRVLNLSIAGRVRKADDFDRADSATEPGNGWTVTSGDTFGISSDELYSVTDADADFAWADQQLADGGLICTVRGTLADGSTYRCPELTFRGLDTSNYLILRLLNTALTLRKVDGGTESAVATLGSSLTTSDGVNYELKVVFEGTRLRSWVDGVEQTPYELTGPNIKYLNKDYTYAGFRLSKAGSPATAARWRQYCSFDAASPHPLSAWEENETSRSFTSDAGFATTLVYVAEGAAFLSALAADTGGAYAGTLTSDETAGIELRTTDPEWPLLLAQGAVEVIRIAASPVNAPPDAAAAYAAMLPALERKAQRMPAPQANVRLMYAP